MATEAVLMVSQTSRLTRREEVAEGTMAFHFEKPSGFDFKPGQFADVASRDPRDGGRDARPHSLQRAGRPHRAGCRTAA